MKYLWIDEYLMKKPGVTKDLQPEWNWIRYHVGGKMFAAILLDEENKPYYINLKLKPDEGEFLRGQYADIIPGYYSNKLHWNSVLPDGAVPDDLMRVMLDKSYFLVLSGFPKARQREITGLSACGADCRPCPFYQKECSGCNSAMGRVFHAPAGKSCPIFACAVQKKCRASCMGCESLPCAIWRDTRDPSLSDDAFRQSMDARMRALRESFPAK